jgi:hypothetical protein
MWGYLVQWWGVEPPQVIGPARGRPPERTDSQVWVVVTVEELEGALRGLQHVEPHDKAHKWRKEGVLGELEEALEHGLSAYFEKRRSAK